MRIKGYFFLLTVLLLGISGLLVYLGKWVDPLYVYIAEGVILLILLYLILFYRKIVKPLDTISNGMELLREQDFSSRLSKVGQYEADRMVNVFNRMMEQMKNERLRLREQNHFLDLLIGASPMGVLILSLDGEIDQANPMALKMLGVHFEEIRQMKLSELDSPLAEGLAVIPKGDTEIVRLSDSNIYKCTHSSFVDRGFQHSFFLIESLTEELIKAEKKAYEKVIRMIAHEVNNTTAGITSTLESVVQVLAEVDGMEELADVMKVSSDRCYSMSRFITRFADVVKIPEPHLLPVKLQEIALSCMRFMEGVCMERSIKLTVDPGKEAIVRMDAVLFEQVLVNIIKNAAESIGQEGEIHIKITSPDCIEVADNGKGISKETEAKMFTPFFSTKPNGQGIGLIFIREVLMKHGCSFSLRTSLDGWTRFRILFPHNLALSKQET